MQKLENLYKIKERKERIIEPFYEDHDWEIEYQRYYQFLIKDFYLLLKEELDSVGKKPIEHGLFKNRILNIPCSRIASEFILKFFYGEFFIEPYSENYNDKENILTVKLKEMSMEKAITGFYNELQRVERTMRTPEEMKEELEQYRLKMEEKRKEMDFLQNRDSLSSIIEDNAIEPYFEFLELLLARAKGAEYQTEDGLVNYKEMEDIAFEYKTELAYYRIISFINFYQLPHHMIKTGSNNFSIYFYTSWKKIKNSVLMELQRIEYKKAEIRARKK